jgi:hypothetical protein
MEHNKKRLKRIEILKKKIIKITLKRLILKSIIHSKNMQPTTISFSCLNLLHIKKKSNKTLLKNICFFTAKNRSTTKRTHLSRYTIKSLALQARLQNATTLKK